MRWLRKLLGKAENVAGHAVGEVEDVIHHPLWPTGGYVATVVPNELWRGAWPNATVLGWLKAHGCKAVINLCSERDQYREVITAGMLPLWIGFEDNTAPTMQQVQHFLLALLAVRGSCYVHCEQGVGRTGCMIAAYRVIHQQWTPDVARAEAEGFGLKLPCQRDFILKLKASAAHA